MNKRNIKSAFAIALIPICIWATVWLVGCNKDISKDIVIKDIIVQRILHDGHNYLLFNVCYPDRLGAVHDPDCPCFLPKPVPISSKHSVEISTPPVMISAPKTYKGQ